MSRLKVYLPVLVVIAVLAGGFLFSQWVRNRDDGSESSASAAEKTAQREESDPATSAAATPRPSRTRTATATAKPGGGASAFEPRDLEADERRGGHTLTRHVGRTDAELKERLQNEPDISAASTYTDQDAAELTVGTALGQNSKKVQTWAGGTSHENLVLRVTVAQAVGRSLKHGETKARAVKTAVVVLKWSGRDWFVLTSYPEAR